MKAFLKSAFFIWHPIWIPFMGVFFYFWITPRFIPPNHVKAKLLATAILSIAIPIIFLTMLINTKMASTAQLKEPKAKRLFLLCFSVLIVSLNQLVISSQLLEIYYFLTGFSISLVLLLLLNLIKINGSLHTMALSTLFGFIMGLSLLYRMDLHYYIGALLFILGWVGSNRISEGIHNLPELLLGSLLGLLPQFYFIGIALMHYRM